MTDNKKIRYSDMFWLFMIGNLLGVLIEGVWYKLIYGHWETHTVTIWGPFCLIYGLGIIVMYIGAVKLKDKNMLIQFVAIAAVADAVEFFCGWLLEYGLHMKAWDYTQDFLNIKGYICLETTVIWGVLGVLFARFAVPRLDLLFDKLHGKGWNIACGILTVFMAVNMICTVFCLVRWKTRHEGIEARNSVERLIDNSYNDDVMQKRFCEWSFR